MQDVSHEHLLIRSVSAVGPVLAFAVGTAWEEMAFPILVRGRSSGGSRMPIIRQNVRDNRTDLSPFMFHLTRDDRAETEWDGSTARENFGTRF